MEEVPHTMLQEVLELLIKVTQEEQDLMFLITSQVVVEDPAAVVEATPNAALILRADEHCGD